MPQDRPNILFFCTDQQRADLMGCMGHPQIRTPSLDALAARGAVLHNLYVQGTVSMPSRASILTGRYPCMHGVTDNGYDLPESEITIADVFRQAGYHTACVGRTHVTCSRPHPILPRTDYHGFTECLHHQCYWVGLDPHGDYLQWIRQEHPDRYQEAAMPNPVDRRDAFCSSWWTLPDHLTMNAWVTDVSLDVIRRHLRERPGQPLLLWAGTWDPHMRYVVPSPWDRMYPPADIPLPVRREGELDDLPPHYRKLALTGWDRSSVPLDDVIRNTRSIYWGMISHVDDQFGRLMRGLEDLGLADNTIVVFTSDHGDCCGDHWVWTKGPYWFDGALKAPGIIAWPGALPAGRRIESLTETIDLMPTLCELAGIPAPATCQGRSMARLLRGEAADHRRDVYTEFHDHNQSGDVMFSIRTDRYRLVHYRDRPYGELYDYQTDPDSLYNRWNDPAYAGAKQQLEMQLLDRLMGNLQRPDTRRDLW